MSNLYFILPPICDNLPDSQIFKSPGIDIKSSEFKGPKPN